MSLLSAQTQCASPALVQSTRTPSPILRNPRGGRLLVANRSSHGGRGGWRVLSASHGRGETQEEAGGAEDDSGPVLSLSAEEVAFRRRVVAGAAVGAVIALGANFLGVTSAILSLDSQLARRLKLDVVYPVKGFKRCIENSKGFEFLYPAEWVGDQRLLYRAVERAERERSLDLPPLQGKGRGRQSGSSTEPIVAFGPPGSDGELNVSVVVAPVYPGFRLELLGGPEEAGALILTKFIAPQGSGKIATLLSASRRQGSPGSNDVYYTLEYTVRATSFFRHNVAVYCASSGLLYSLNSQASEDTWPDVKDTLQEVANSFTVVL